MELESVGCTKWCMLMMKRLETLDQCKKECKKYKLIAPTHSNICFECGTQFHINYLESTKVCTRCGISVDILMDDAYDYSTMDRYNGNRHHHYDPKEHFSQTLCDFTCTGMRSVPIKVMAYCRTVLGTGIHVTSENVFTVLQMGGYRAYYQHKYEITNRLRGKPEFVVTSVEVQRMRDIYARYRQEIIPFQQSHYIGTCSKMGKLRIYWPMRYILSKICEEINRGDLKLFIRGIKDKSKLKQYDFYWNKLKVLIDSSRPVCNLQDPSIHAKSLRPSRRSF
jgi:hypothetical protein